MDTDTRAAAVARDRSDPLAGFRDRFALPGGTVYLGLYLKTWLSPVHEGVRHFCRAYMDTPARRNLVGGFFTGLTMRWFRDAFCAEEKLIAERMGMDTYSLLEEMASRVPAGGWIVLPLAWVWLGWPALSEWVRPLATS